MGQKQGAIDEGHEVWRKIRDEGYQHACFSFIWPAGNKPADWRVANSNANMAGEWLADYLDGHGWTAEDGKNINIICHSLGARVALECLDVLHGKYQKSINTVHLLGGAVKTSAVRKFYPTAINNGCSWMHNWYSGSDPVLSELYVHLEQAPAIGSKALTNSPFLELTSYPTGMKQHCQYMDYE